MAKTTKFINGVFITIIIYFIAILLGFYLNKIVPIFSPTFWTHSLMLLLSILVIYLFKKDVHYQISLPKFKKTLKPILFGCLTSIIVPMIVTIIILAFGGKLEGSKLMENITPLQAIIFIFIYGPIAEELLFRGFLLNYLAPLSNRSIVIFKRHISLSVIIAALMFGLAHFILLASGQSISFVINTFCFTFTLGIFSGYYQTKYHNNAYAIITHMSGNLFAVLVLILTY